MSSFTRRCLGRSSAGCRWPTNGSKAPISSASCLPATTTSSRWMRSSPQPSACSSPRVRSSSSATSRWSRPGGRTARPGTRIVKRTSQVTAPPEKTIYNFHCPPYGSGLDDAPEIDENMRPKHGGRSIVPVGSTAVRDAIKEGQPALALHGHIHEAKGNTRIGRTLCINPGSSYEQGQLLGAVVNLDGGKKVKRFVLTSG